MRLFTALYRLGLRALPEPVRRRDGAEIERLFAEVVLDVRGRRGSGAAFLRALRELADLLAAGVRLRWRSLRTCRSSASDAPRRQGEPVKALLHELRFAARALFRRPGYATVAVLTLGLGLGASTTLFGVVDHVLLRPLPYPEGERLVMVWRVIERLGLDRAPISYPDFADWRSGSRSFSHLAAFTGAQTILLGEGDPTLLRGARVTGELFDTLGRRPLLGRLVDRADDDPAAEPVVVLAEGLWRRRFGADPAVIGRTVRLGDTPAQVIGVLPGDVDFPSPDTDFWTPLRLTATSEERDMNFLQVVGRLAPGVPQDQAERELRAVAARVAAEHPGENEVDGVWLERRHEFMVGDVRPVLVVLLGAAAALLLLACANVSNLLLARSVERRRELALRSALGAGAGRVGASVVAESLLLAAGGGALGLALTAGATHLLLALDPVGLPRREEIAVDLRVLLIGAAVCLACGLACGLVPLLAGEHRTPSGILAGGARTTGDRRGGRLQAGLVVAQVALATVLLVGACLLGQSFLRLVSVEPGFEGDSVLTARVVPSAAAYPTAADLDRFYSELLERLGALPGVEAAGATWSLPFSHVPASWGGPISASSTYVAAEAIGREEGFEVTLEPIRGDYFRTLGIPVLAGRTFSAADRADAPPVAVVNQTLARRLWPDGRAVGRRLVEPDDPTDAVTVVGVVGDVRHAGLDRSAQPLAYLPYSQASWSHALFVTVRTAGEPQAVAEAVRAEVRAIDAAAVVTGVGVLSDLVASSVAAPRLRAVVFGGLGGSAGGLAALGIYGVLAFAVTRRAREMALRLALGAGRRRLLGEVLARGVALMALGLVLGGAGAAAGSRALARFLFEVRPLDPLTFAAVPATLLALGILASWLPARRAAAADPASALREG